MVQGQEQAPVLLLIDDAPAIHRLLAFKLKNEGLEFLAAFGGEEGIELAASQKPALILLDLKMPGMDGFQTLRALKNNPATIEIPVIMVSGSSGAAEKVKSFELGAMDFVCKPFDVHELRARINSAIRLQSLMRMLELRARIDGLTGLWNRAYFNERLASELDSASRKGTPLSLVLCDLDHFKKLNDTFGHPAGDAVIQGFAAVLNSEVRSYDVACRYGGEEFVILLPDSGRESALGVSERIRVALEARRWPNYPEVRATASFGLADGPAAGMTGPAGWIEAADKALYASKQGGRNRVTCYPGPSGEGAPKLALAS